MNTRQLLSLVWEKSKLNLKSEATINYLSYTWWVIEPVLHMMAYYLVFELLLNRGGPGFAFFLLTGLVPWLWFSKTVTQGSNSLVTASGLISQIAIPKLFFPFVVITQAGVKQIIVFLLLLICLTLSGLTPTVYWLASVPLFIVQLLFMGVLACLLAVIVTVIRDLSFVIPTLMQFLFFVSGIFFSLEEVAPNHLDLVFINPVAGLIHQYREALLYEQWPDWAYLGKIALLSVLFWVLTLHIYRRQEYAIARRVQE